jgi:hypothetical protein
MTMVFQSIRHMTLVRYRGVITGLLLHVFGYFQDNGIELPSSDSVLSRMASMMMKHSRQEEDMVQRIERIVVLERS